MIQLPRFTATTPAEQNKELRAALVSVIKQANLEISTLNKKLKDMEAKVNGK